MDLNALRKMARKQREAEEAEDNTGTGNHSQARYSC